MSATYYVAQSGQSAALVLGADILHLSDGTPVWLSDGSVWHSPDHASAVLLSDQSATFGPNGSYAQAPTLVVDGSDNIYIFGVDPTGASQMLVRAVNTAGTVLGSFTFTATDQTGVNAYAATWSGDGGGTNSAGHLVLFVNGRSSTTGDAGYLVVDAGSVLAGTGVVDATDFTAFGSGTDFSVTGDIRNDGFGAASGLIVYATPSETAASYWTCSTAGALTLTAATGTAWTATNYSSPPTLLRYGAASYLVVQTTSSTTYAGPITNGAFGTQVSMSTSTLLGVANNPVGAFVDPSTSGRVWVEGVTTAGQMVRAPVNVASGAATFGTAVDDALLSNVYAAPPAPLMVVEPRGTTVDWVDAVQTGSATYGVDAGGLAFASAPAAPTLTAPANTSALDASSGVQFQATYNSTDGANQNGYAQEIELSGASAFSYYNASTNALQSTEVWNAVSTVPGAAWTWTVPSSALANGNTYVWSAASQEALGGLQGPYASTFTFTTETAPTLTVTGPTGTVVGATPALTYTATPASGTSITGGRWLLYLTSVTQASGFSINIGEGIIPSGAVSDVTWTGNPGTVAMQSGVALTNNTGYTAYAAVYETGTVWSTTVSSPFTVTFDSPATPTVTALATTDPTTGCPMIAVTVQGHDNLLSAVDASFETGVGTWVGANACTLTTDTTWAADGSHSLQVTATGSGAEWANSSTAYPVTAGQEISGTVTFGPQAGGRAVTVGIQCSNGGVLGPTWTNPTTLSTTQATTITIPAQTIPAGVTAAGLVCGCSASVSGDVFDMDEAGLFPGTVTTWTAGGFAGVGQAIITRPDGSYARGASQVHPLALPSPSQQATVNDYEVPPNKPYTYTAVTQVVVNSTVTLVSPVSAASTPQTLVTSGWWELDPTNPSSAVSAQVTNWQPVNTLPATAHQVMGQSVMNFVTDVPLNQDFSATFEVFHADVYDALEALLTSSAVLFISSPFAATDTGWFAIGPQSGGLSTGAGVQTKQAKLLPSTSSAPHRTIQVTAVAQARPPT